MASTLGQLNPLRYRGYVYDTETGLYYLQSRYYDPTLRRFVNADGLTATGQGIIGNNMFAYCINNPANRLDPTGMIALVNKRDMVAKIGAADIAQQLSWIEENVGVQAYLNPEYGVTEYRFFVTRRYGVGYSKNLGDEKAVNLYAHANDFNGDTSLDLSAGVKANFNNFGVSYELGTDSSIGIHTAGWDLDLGTNELGRGYIQISRDTGNGYVFEKYSFNIPEIVLIAYACPQFVSLAGPQTLGVLSNMWGAVGQVF